MKLIIKNIDTYDIGHDDSIDEFIIYVATNENQLVRAYTKIYGDKVLHETIFMLKKQYNTKQIINVPLHLTSQEVLDELQN